MIQHFTDGSRIGMDVGWEWVAEVGCEPNVFGFTVFTDPQTGTIKKNIYLY